MYMYNFLLRVVSLCCLLYLIIFMSGDVAKGMKRHSGQMYIGVIDRMINDHAVILIEQLKEECLVDRTAVTFPTKEQMWVSVQVFFNDDQILCKNLLYNPHKTEEMTKRMELIQKKLRNH